MKKLVYFFIFSLFLILPTTVVFAHSGNTDAYGCHTCRTNCASYGLSYGEYHCHNPKEYSSPSYQTPSIPSCPLMSYYDSLAGKCKCMSGYVVGEDMLGNQTCVSGASKCQGIYGYGSEYDSISNKCECRYGYIMSGGKCITETEYCRLNLGYNSKYNSLYDRCECNYGYVFYNSRCLNGGEYCTEKLGSNSDYDSLTKECECNYGYEFDGFKCVTKQINTYTKIINCPSNASLVGSNCYCNNGYQINGNGTGCEKIIELPNITMIENPNKEPGPIECVNGSARSLDGISCVKIPVNAHVVNSKTDIWFCNEGYKEVGNSCVKINELVTNTAQLIIEKGSLTTTSVDKETLVEFGNVTTSSVFDRIWNFLKLLKFW